MLFTSLSELVNIHINIYPILYSEKLTYDVLKFYIISITQNISRTKYMSQTHS